MSDPETSWTQLIVNREEGRLNTESLQNRISFESQLIQRTVTEHQHNLGASLGASLDSRLVHQHQFIQTGFQYLGSETSAIHAGVTQIHSMLQPVASSISQLSQMHASLRRLVKYNWMLVLSLIVNIDQESQVHKLDPADLALRTRQGDVCEAQSLNRTLRTFQKRHTKARPDISLCECRTQKSNFSLCRWPVAFSRTVTKIHEPDCPYSATEVLTTDIDLRVSFCFDLLRRKFTLAMGISSSLVGGVGLRAGLRAVNIVKYDSKAFSIVHKFCDYGELDKLRQPGYWKQTAMELQHVFQTRQATPHDRLIDGQTLMHVRYAL